MRAFLMALSLTLPIAAAAETPADIARQVWPAGAPASENARPTAGAASAGAFGPRDLARQSLPRGVSLSQARVPALREAAGAFGPADLARLRGDGAPAFLTGRPAGYLTARNLGAHE